MYQITILLILCITLTISTSIGVYFLLKRLSYRKNFISTESLNAMEYIQDGFILLDENNNYQFSNKAAAIMLPEITKLVKGDNISSCGGWPEEIKEMENGALEFSVGDSETKYFKASVSPVFRKDQVLKAKIILLNDITGNVDLIKKLKNAAYIDALTEIYNRKHFFELAAVNMERAVRLNQPIYTAMLDLDSFKNVNDNFGHTAGDLVLKQTAAIIRHTIRSYDLVGRYGGEEFVLLITDLDETMAANLMERIRENIEHSVICYEGNEIKITCSIGFAKFEEGDTLETSLRKADKAMYAAKKTNRNEVRVYHSSLEKAT